MKKFALIALIVVLVFVYSLISLTPRAEQEQDLKFINDFFNQSHNALNSSVVQAREFNSLLKGLILEANNSFATEDQKKESQLILAYLNSFQEDLEWIAEKDNEYYQQMIKEKDYVKARDLMKKEIALLSISNLIILSNNSSQKIIELNQGSKESLIEEAELLVSEKKEIQLSFNLSEETLKKANIAESEVNAEALKLMNEFIELKTNVFIAEQELNKKYVEGVKLIQLNLALISSN